MNRRRVPVRDLIHHSRQVLSRVADGERIEVTRNGKVIAVMTAPDPTESALDDLVASGDIPADWRQRQASLRRRLHTLPVHDQPPGPSIGSAAICADRAESADR